MATHPPSERQATPLVSFDHEKLRVYHAAIEFVSTAHAVAGATTPGHARLVDQLQRACTSIPLNIAEGAAEYRWKEKARFYRIARRSAAESAAILDVLRELRLADGGRLDEARLTLGAVFAMLTTIARRRPRDGERERERERERDRDREGK